MRPKVLLIGATGIFGRKFIEKYHAEFDIVGVARKPTHDNAARYSFIAGDIVTGLPALFERVNQKAWVPDAVINAAVVADFRSLDDPDKNLEKEFQTNFFAPINIIRECLLRFWQNDVENRAKRRNVVNLSSIVGSQIFKVNSASHWSYASYAAAKAALNSMSAYLAHDLERFGIRVNAVGPCSFPTHVSTDRVCHLVRALVLGQDTGRVIELTREYERDLKTPVFTFNA